MARSLTAADVRAVTGYSRDELRGLLNALPEISGQASERFARSYTHADLVLLNAIHQLDVVMGLRRNMIALLLPHLRAALASPRGASNDGWLEITFAPLGAKRVATAAGPREVLRLALGPIFGAVEEHLDVGSAGTTAPLAWGPTLVQKRRRGA